jgi:hypothetical protein
LRQTAKKEIQMNDGGKGSARRPRQVSNEDYENRWDAIFGRDKLSEQAKRERALDEMVRISQELGLYDELDVQEPQESTAGHDGQDTSR